MSHTRATIPASSSSEFPASVHPLELSGTAHPEDMFPDADEASPALSEEWPVPTTVSEVFRHSGWRHDRERIRKAFWRTAQSVTRLTAFDACGSEIYVHRSLVQPFEYRLGGSYCHDRLCVPCAGDRSRTIARNIVAGLPNSRVRFLTLTLVEGDKSLGEKLDFLQSCFSRLRKTRLWKRKVKGGAAFLEVKRSSRTENWHVHYHVLLVGGFLPHADIKRTWHTITGESYIVDIRSAGSRDAVAKYVCKYASKPVDREFFADPALLDEAILALHRRRLCQTFGCLRNVKLTDKGQSDGWEAIGTLDAFLRRERDGDEESAAILALMRSEPLDDARHWFNSRPNPPPAVECPCFRQMRLLDGHLDMWG